MANIPNTTQTPNIIFNGLMKEMSDTELRVVLIVTRATLGWIMDREKGMRKEEDWISHSQLKHKTGRESGAISKAIDRCIQKGWIEARDHSGELLDTNSSSSLRSSKRKMSRFISRPESSDQHRTINYFLRSLAHSANSRGQK